MFGDVKELGITHRSKHDIMGSKSRSAPDAALQKRAFEALADIFTKYEPQEPGHNGPHPSIEIEILDSSTSVLDGAQILEDETERAIGIPKPTLLAAFLHARHLFMSTPISERESPEIDSATKIILLYDPEFLTAANARKAYLTNLMDMKAAYGPMHSIMLTHAVRREMWFLTTILTSPLHRQSKSPTLWWQRAWVFKTFVTSDACPGLMSTKGDLMGEVEGVLRAGERHQHNYYAFGYLRRVLPLLLRAVEEREANKVDGNVTLNKREVLERMLKWCKAHPSDTSGWSFLGHWMDHDYGTPEKARVMESTFKFAIDLHWKGEALWCFLRTLIGTAHEDDVIAKDIRKAMAELCPRLVREENG